MKGFTRFLSIVFLVHLAPIGPVRAQPSSSPVSSVEAEAEEPSVSSPASVATAKSPSSLTVGGYVEAFYQWNFTDPSNGITNYRGFDNRHNSFTLSNLALDARYDDELLFARLTLQVGHTPSTYYLAEPSLPGSSGANATSPELWKYVQQAYGGYRFAALHDLAISAGVFLSPIGPESMAVRDNWNWSRSNLFFGLPFYHTGVRATYPISDAWAATLAAFNGWNSVVDNNREKSLMTQLTFTAPEVVWSALYFGGVERPKGASEGRAFRHLFDTHLTWNARAWLSVLAHANAGFEANDFGRSRWAAGALYSRARVIAPLFVSVRGDVFREHVTGGASGRASPLFWPVDWVSSATATLDYRPHERLSFELELRHDQAQGNMFFGGKVAGDGAQVAFVPNRVSQDTLTVGTTAWF